MATVEKSIVSIEKYLNPYDYVPVVASFSGMIRILASSVQIAVSTYFGIIGALLSRPGVERKNALWQGYIFVLHGFGNMVRGSICMIPFVNIGLYFYDTRVGRMNYPHEKMDFNVSPLMPKQLIART